LCVTPARLAAGSLVVDGDDHAYLFRARRLAVGDEVVVFDGAGREARAVVREVEGARARLEVGEVGAVVRPAPHITVIQALLKGERMDWCLEKLVEVGTDELVVCETARGVVRLDDERRAKRSIRHQAIAREAARQCGRADVPPVRAAASLDEALADPRVTGAALRLVGDPSSSTPLLAAASTPGEVVLLIGPEGGLSPDELTRAAAAGFVAVSLGATILRAETAGAAAVFAIRAAICARG
jgi:16S rRNA (uracil1498-N3)-methyltransferase